MSVWKSSPLALLHPLPLWERVDRRREAAASRVRGYGPSVERDPSPALHASHFGHPLPQGERGRKRCFA
jgi:hypothetical protein